MAIKQIKISAKAEFLKPKYVWHRLHVFVHEVYAFPQTYKRTQTTILSESLPLSLFPFCVSSRLLLSFKFLFIKFVT